MHLTAITTATILAYASSALGSTILANNLCKEDLWFTPVNGSQATPGPYKVSSGLETAMPIEGVGNSLGVTKTEEYWSPNTPKLILGTSTSKGILYWSVSNVDGDPFAGESFNITGCESAEGYDEKVHACTDGGFTLSIDLCSHNAVRLLSIL